MFIYYIIFSDFLQKLVVGIDVILIENSANTFYDTNKEIGIWMRNITILANIKSHNSGGLDAVGEEEIKLIPICNVICFELANIENTRIARIQFDNLINVRFLESGSNLFSVADYSNIIGWSVFDSNS